MTDFETQVIKSIRNTGKTIFISCRCDAGRVVLVEVKSKKMIVRCRGCGARYMS